MVYSRRAQHNITLEPATEHDVVQTVRFANEHNLPFLAVASGHGAITTVERLQNGIEIWMRQLSSISIAEDGKTATFGGGVLVNNVTDALWSAGKQTVTGGCECVSLLGPGLGGGHGFLQGRHGLISDQFIAMNIVLADGSLHTLNPESELWWAVQGAGHNFGIVTSVTSKIHEVKHPNWAYQSFIFTGDKVEGLYETINRHLLKNGTQSVDIINYSFFFNHPGMDPVSPVIAFFILQEGVDAVDPVYTAPFTALGSSPPCQKAGFVNIRFPIELQTYNISAQRQVYDVFASAIRANPALNGSLFLFEDCSTQGVKAVPHESTAYPFRQSNLLVAPLIIYKSSGAELDERAEELGVSLRQILHEASGQDELHAYVNYAFGNEDVKSWYGYEEWRQERLLALKNKYDPDREFSFYAPIA
ncbi:hypothetical protein BDV95DRAFT_628008 [Massariosphaeria phaeospora]|uniref:FAD-binding PCMH-type domain-containing protein n=1 Tax=Massariosphaeria phaeospora TaxID=100035 RepID=A0A7C8IGB3_9PLEO|nr:hypothetical protein BDV95DRAFT_628008 [Massariosphaeria phaeospora]